MGLAERYPVRYTIEDWKHWQGDWELIEGVPYAMASPRPINQILLSRLTFLLESLFERECIKCFVGVELDWYVSYDTVIRPDIMVLCGEIPERVETTPHMVIEIVSPSSRQMDEGLKFELCEREGVKYFVLVYPDERMVKVFELLGGRYKDKKDKVFTFGKCELSIDFPKAFERLR